MKVYNFAIALLIFVFSLSSERLAGQDIPVPKNVIFFIGDGMGFNHVDATSIFKYGETGKLVFESPDWMRVAQATYPAIIKTHPDTIFAEGYDPGQAWSDPEYLKQGFTDSGAAGTALSTGVKTYRSSIGIGIHGDTLLHLSQHAKNIGKSAGVITSVQLSHATPAGFAANNAHRRNYEEIAQQMILQTQLDVLIGCGHPNFNDDARRTLKTDHRYVGGKQLWRQLRQSDGNTTFRLNGNDFIVADTDGNGEPTPWTLVTSENEFADIANGKEIPQRLLGVPKVRSTLQFSRRGNDKTQPFQQPFNSNLPDLEMITVAAVNVLSQNPEGFFLMVEGGAIDWAAHDNNSGRLIEEMYDFVKAVAAIVRWVETHSSWEETLLVVTSDHETGMLFGPADDTSIMQPVENRGKGVLPGMQWHSNDHTNMLVPVYVRGAGSEKYRLLATQYDPLKGPYLQNTDIPNAIFRLWGRE